MSKSTIISVAVVLIVCGLFANKIQQQIKSKEKYQDMFSAKDYAKDNWVSRPNFRADLDPRFDSTRYGGNIVGTFPGMDVQGAPLTPVESIIGVSTPSYATMGGAAGAYADPRLPSGGLSNSQVNNILSEKFGRGAGSKADYTDPKSLMPATNMKSVLANAGARDPSDPSTFMYDRYLFAPLKRRYPNVNVDFIRGDLAIPQLRMGWFDPAPVAKQDLMSGYFSDYLDVQQSTAIRDSIFERAPNAVHDNIPTGRLAEETIYSLL